MPKRPTLSFYSTRNCFRKKYKGQTYYLGTGGRQKDETENQHYERACAEWFRVKDQIDGQLRQGVPANQVTVVRDSLVRPSSVPACHFASIHVRTPLISARRAETPALLFDVIEEYLKEERGDAIRGEGAISTYRTKKDALDDFGKFMSVYACYIMDDLSVALMTQYRNATKSLPPYVARKRVGKKIVEESRPISKHTAKRRLATVRAFLKWAYRNEFIDKLPRNVDETYARIDLPDPKPITFSRDEVRELFAAANERNKYSRTKRRRNALYVLLGLNCGYGSGDIATLRHGQIDWDTGIVDRKREKTGSPQVHWLWPLTREILREEMTDPSESDLVLLGMKGQPLVEEFIDKPISRTNPIGRSLDRVRRKLVDTGKTHWEGPKKGIAILRKTGADLLKQQYPAMPHIFKQYLGHKDRDVSRHYTREHYGPLFDALKWMSDYFALDDLNA